MCYGMPQSTLHSIVLQILRGQHPTTDIIRKELWCGEFSPLFLGGLPLAMASCGLSPLASEGETPALRRALIWIAEGAVVAHDSTACVGGFLFVVLYFSSLNIFLRSFFL